MTIEQLDTILRYADVQPAQPIYVEVDFSGTGKQLCKIHSFQTATDGIKLNIVACELNKNRWKPTDEQISALERCVDYLDESDNEDAAIIGSLCHDLKLISN